MFLTGVDSHIVGYGTMTDEHTPETEGQPGYETFLNSRTETIPQLLRDTGYHTYITGKWDMGGRGNEALRPSNRGFEESWVLVEGSGSHYDSTGVFADLPTVTYAENGKNIDLPEDFYSSKTYVDKMIEYIDKHGDDDDPFFAYLSFTAPHWPLQAPAEFIDRYKGVYDKGYEGIRERRLQRMRDLGLLTEGQQPAEPHELIPAWQDLSPTHQKLEVRRMEIYAGMVEAMDYHTGRLLDYLRVTGKWDDTLILYLIHI